MFTHDIHEVSPPMQPIGAIICMHGLGADNRNFEFLVPEITQNNALPLRFIFPNAPVRKITMNPHWPLRAWYDIFSLSHLEKEDEAGLMQARAFVDGLIADQIAKGIPSDKIIVAGFSQGGAMALHVGLRYPQRLAGILGMSCYLPLVQKIEHEFSAANKDTPILLTHGTQDTVLPLEVSRISKLALKRNHTNVELKEYPMGHEVCLQEMRDIKQWVWNIYS
jgi:phospholipase/carboxylesterase